MLKDKNPKEQYTEMGMFSRLKEVCSSLPGCRRAGSPGLLQLSLSGPCSKFITNFFNWVLPFPAVAGQNSLSHLHNCHLLCILETSFHTGAVPNLLTYFLWFQKLFCSMEMQFLNFRVPYPFSGCVRGLQPRFHWVPVENSLCSVEISCSLLVPGVVRPQEIRFVCFAEEVVVLLRSEEKVIELRCCFPVRLVLEYPAWTPVCFINLACMLLSGSTG